ncbi:MAG: prolyl oligopeptidase family serine peptidase [Halieaceae bacterium]|jgi:dipeptidyl-peptidase 4|nr:prolyl oligopeptidase family serine peptidase [Halieaceae bacterium]
MNLNQIRGLITSSLLMLTFVDYNVHAANEAFSIDTLYGVPSIIGTEPGGAAWSRDGQKLAFLWNDKGGTFRDIWLYDKASGEKRQLTRLASRVDVAQEHKGIAEVHWFGPQAQQVAYALDGQLQLSTAQGKILTVDTGLEGIRQLATSPDGNRLSFVASSDADGSTNKLVKGQALWVLDYAPEKVRQVRLLLNPGHVDSSVKSHQWGRDNRQISFDLQHEGDMAKRKIHYYHKGKLQVDTVIRAFPGEPNLRFSVGVIDAQTGKSKLLERQDDRFPIWNYGLSARGDKLFVNESDPYVKLHRIEMYELTTGTRETFYREHDPKHLRPDWKAAWASGDDGLIILTDRDGFGHLYHQRKAAGGARQLTTGNWEISDFAVADSSRQIYFRANKAHGAEHQLYRVPLNGGDVTRISGGKGGTHKIVYAPDMRSAASVFSNDKTPPDLYLIEFESLKSKRVTNSPSSAFHNRKWADVRYIHFGSHIDSTPLIGRLSLPPKFDPAKRYPLIVGSVYSDSVLNQWGGRTSHPTWGLDQHLVAQGYILLNVNVRGSWGQGREHNQGLLNGYGNIDIDDLHSGVLHLVNEGYADPARVGIWGSSYGGLMTIMSLSKKADVYAVGIAGAPATNVWHAYPEQMWVMGPAEGDDMPGRYQNQSALYHTDGLQDPLMIIHGNRDHVVLYSDTIAVTNNLIARRQPFELVTLPGAGHGWDAEGNDQRIFAFKKMVAFFNRHLRPAGE